MSRAAAAVGYLHRIGAFTRYPGLTATVSVDSSAQRVIVEVHAPIHLPLHVPGSPERADIGATSAATVGVDECGEGLALRPRRRSGRP